jgi:hypothetical protein
MILKIIVYCQCHVTRATSLDHLVGAGDYRVGHGDSECFGGCYIDGQIELRWRLDR